MDSTLTDTQLWYAYAAGFFDAEGSFCISRVKMGQYSDNHRLIIDVGQHVDRIDVLYELQRSFGGRVHVRKHGRKSFTPGGVGFANWHLQKRVDVEVFIRAILPYLRCKRPQAEIALKFLETVNFKRKVVRRAGVSGRHGLNGTERISDAQMELREGFRLQMRDANRLSTRVAQALAVPEAAVLDTAD